MLYCYIELLVVGIKIETSSSVKVKTQGLLDHVHRSQCGEVSIGLPPLQSYSYMHTLPKK